MDSPRNILLVEDELDFAQLVAKRLNSAGYEVTIASDAYSGTQACVQKQFHLVILDLSMPAGGGFLMLERIRKIPSKIMLPVIFLTGLDVNEEIRRLANKYRVVEIFKKPYDHEQFLAR